MHTILLLLGAKPSSTKDILTGSSKMALKLTKWLTPHAYPCFVYIDKAKGLMHNKWADRLGLV